MMAEAAQSRDGHFIERAPADKDHERGDNLWELVLAASGREREDLSPYFDVSLAVLHGTPDSPQASGQESHSMEICCLSP